MNELSSRQRAELPARAQPLKPIVQIGKGGLTEAVERSVRDVLATRELIKIKVLKAAPQTAAEIGELLAGHLPGVYLIQVVGRSLVLYRPRPEAPPP